MTLINISISDERIYVKKQTCSDQFCQIDGIRIRYWIAGTGQKKVILVHGLGGSIEAWNENVEPLSDEYTVYAIELPGHGKSDKPHVRYTLDFFSQFLSRFVDEFKISRFHIVGLSFGGAIALRYVINNPEKIDKVILVASAGLDPRMGRLFSLSNLAPLRKITWIVPRWLFRYYAKATVYDARILSPEIIDLYYKLLKDRDFRQVLLSIQRENFNFFGFGSRPLRRLAQDIHTIDKETLIVWGKNDTMIPVANASKGKQKIAKSQIVVFDKCSHNPQYEKTDDFNKVVAGFLREGRTV